TSRVGGSRRACSWWRRSAAGGARATCRRRATSLRVAPGSDPSASVSLAYGSAPFLRRGSRCLRRGTLGVAQGVQPFDQFAVGCPARGRVGGPEIAHAAGELALQLRHQLRLLGCQVVPLAATAREVVEVRRAVGVADELQRRPNQRGPVAQNRVPRASSPAV